MLSQQMTLSAVLVRLVIPVFLVFICPFLSAKEQIETSESYLAPLTSLKPLYKQISEDWLLPSFDIKGDSIRAYQNPRKSDYYDQIAFGVGFNPITSIGEAYRLSLEGLEVEPGHLEKTNVVIQGSSLYGNPQVASDLDVLVFNNSDLPVIKFSSSFRLNLEKVIRDQFSNHSNLGVSFFWDPRMKEHYAKANYDLYIHIKDQNSGEKKVVFLNISFAEFDPREDVIKQAKSLFFKAYYHLDGSDYSIIPSLGESISAEQMLQDIEDYFHIRAKDLKEAIEHFIQIESFIKDMPGMAKKTYLGMILGDGIESKYFNIHRGESEGKFARYSDNDYIKNQLRYYMLKRILRHLLELGAILGNDALMEILARLLIELEQDGNKMDHENLMQNYWKIISSHIDYFTDITSEQIRLGVHTRFFPSSHTMIESKPSIVGASA